MHLDQRWHDKMKQYRHTLQSRGIVQSMSRIATCANNGAMENFFGLLKEEMYDGEEIISYEKLKKKIEKYMDYYNNDRIKQRLAGIGPVKYRAYASRLAA